MPQLHLSKANAQKILRTTEASGLPRTYIIGSFAKRVTISSQQTRAFNLIWALKTEGLISAKCNIGIVGGGFAGISAAVGALLAGCTVSLYEQNSDVLNIQSGNNTRFLHPNILDFPLKRSSLTETKFPYLNWSADFASNVVDSVRRQWKIVHDGCSMLSVFLRCSVSKITTIENRPYVVHSHGRGGASHDVVIVAAGFGVEKAINALPTHPYWNDDSLHRPLPNRLFRRYLVTGCGDGGLIDVLRLRIADFKHASIVEMVSSLQNHDKITDRLLEIEESAKGKSNPEAISTFIRDQYMLIMEWPEVQPILHRIQLRNDTSVVLNGSALTPMTLKSSILNRFAVALILQKRDNGFTYKSGKIALSDISQISGIDYNEYAVIQEGKQWMEKFEDVIIRHGPTEIVESIEGIKKIQYNDRDDEMFSVEKLWPARFFDRIDSILIDNGPVKEVILDNQINDLIQLHTASKLRLQGRIDCESMLLKLISTNRDQVGFAQFELGLLYLGMGRHKEAFDMLRRANNSLPKIFRCLVYPLVLLIDSAKTLAAKSDCILGCEKENVSAVSHKFALYTGFQRGWAYLLADDHKSAHAAWSGVDHCLDHSSIILGYPFTERTLKLDELLIQLFAKPNMDTPEKFDHWWNGRCAKILRESGNQGHVAVMSATIQILKKNELVLEKFVKLTESWKGTPRVSSVATLQARLELFLERIHNLSR